MTPGVWIRALFALGLAGLLAALPVPAAAQDDGDTARAGALFASGNQHLQAATRARGDRRTRELEAALHDYQESLRIVRSRNVLFNASLALEMLGRDAEAFDFLVEYLAVPGISDSERTEATRRIDAIRPRVAVLRITSVPPGAEVWIDRRDLAPRGRTPLEVAVAGGERQLWLRADGYRETEAHATATVGATTPVEVPLEAEPVSLQVLAPGEVRLTLDGEPIQPGAHVPIAPGMHVVRLEIEGLSAVERRFEVLPGAAPMVIDLASAVAASSPRSSSAVVAVVADAAARVLVDGVVVGGGHRVEVPVPAGDHEIRVEADGYEPFAERRSFEVRQRLQLSVDLSPSPRGGSLHAPRAIFGVAAILGLLGSGGAMIAAWQSHEQYRSCDPTPGAPYARCVQLFDQTRDLNLATDVAWSITAAFGLTAFVLAVVDDRGSALPSTGEFSAMIVPGGGGLSFSMRGAP
jgi:hypothetical protein